MASLVGGECATDNGAVEEASPALTAQQTEQAEQQWKLAQFRMLRMEAEYNACIAAEGKLGANVVEDSGNDAKEVPTESPAASGYAQLDCDVLVDEESNEAPVDEEESEAFGEFQFAQFPEEERVLKTAPNEEIICAMKSMKWRPKRDRVLRP